MDWPKSDFFWGRGGGFKKMKFSFNIMINTKIPNRPKKAFKSVY